MNHTDSRYASLAFYYVRDRQSLARTEAVAFSGPGVETIESFFEEEDDEVAVKYAILKTEDPIERVLRIDPANAGVCLRRAIDQALAPGGRRCSWTARRSGLGTTRTATRSSAPPRATSRSRPRSCAAEGRSA